MIELIVYPKSRDEKLINPSPFCSKVEIFLKLAGLDYEVNEFNANPAKFENGKLPVIKHENKMIHDSNLILKYLVQNFQINIDDHLTMEAKSIGFTLCKMLEDNLYWSLLHERWFIDKNWNKLKNDYFGHIPFLVRGLATTIVRKSTLKSAIGHGMSRHPDEQVLEFGKEAIESLSHLLASKPFILGEQVSSYDATVYAFVSSILHSDLGTYLKNEAEKYQNLIDYDSRMFELVFN